MRTSQVLVCLFSVCSFLFSVCSFLFSVCSFLFSVCSFLQLCEEMCLKRFAVGTAFDSTRVDAVCHMSNSLHIIRTFSNNTMFAIRPFAQKIKRIAV